MHFLAIEDHTPSFIRELLHDAVAIKKNPGEYNTLLAGKVIALVFEKPSNRTRISFEVGIRQLGGSAIYIQAGEIGMNQREPISDVAQVFSRYVDGVMIRTFRHEDLEEFAANSAIPVINGLSDKSHPCQAMADVLTIFEHKGRLEGVKICYIGDGNNVCRALIAAATAFGMTVNVCCPKGYEPGAMKAPYTLYHYPYEAVKGADVIYTDVWTSMGQEEEAARRLADFADFSVTASLMGKAKEEAIFMHCLPAHRGEEVEAEVIDGPQSVVFDQAENRLHAQKAILRKLLT